MERAPVSLSILRKDGDVKRGDKISTITSYLPNWRGHGGRHPTHSSVEFDRQLDKISLWIEEWNHEQRCQLIEALLRRSNHQQFQFLYTVMQPHQHRDFMYTAQKQFPETEFTPVSTHTTREVKRRVQLHREDNYYRVKSAYFHMDDEVKEQNKVVRRVRLPEILQENHIIIHKNDTSISFGTKSIASLPKLCSVPKKRSNKSIRKYKLLQASKEELYNGPANDRFVDMPIKRHIQDERLTQSVPVFSTSSRADKSAMSSTKPGSTAKFTESKPDSDQIFDLSTNASTVVHWYTDLWTDVKRNEFLHKLILKLDPRQHYFISSFMLVRRHRDFLTLLPEKIVLCILNILDPKELCKCAEVSKSWYSLAHNNKLWKWKCDAVNIKVTIPTNPVWKKVYRDNVILERNWHHGTYRTVDMKGNSAPWKEAVGVEAVIFDRNILVSGSQDKTVKIWDIKTGRCAHTFEGHQGGVWCLSFFTPNLILSGSHDGTIKIWNVKERKMARSILAHDGPIWAMVRHGKILVSVSQDKTAKVWDISRCLLLKTLTGHNKPIFAVDMNEDGTLVITGSADRTVKIWDVETGEVKKTIWVSSTTSVMAVSYHKGFIAAGYDNVVCLHRETGKLIKTFNEHEKRVESVQLKIEDPEKITGALISSGQGGLVKIWNTKMPQSIQTYKLSKEGGTVKSIKFDELRIVGGLKDRIRILDFQAPNSD
ncbi:FBXW7 [Mytilus edulis]|uniref:FBXW7 n=1 Tax=Mytilus edulis TaxID=6550 RepID=A0A8S3VAV5_MYTED|nr:FBXW7 [Mytilus edulis]